MDADPPLDYLLDGPVGLTPGREELLAIVARSRARRNRLAALGMVATLTAGAVGGWLVGAQSGRSSGGARLASGFAAGGSSTSAPLPRGVLGEPAVAPAPEPLVKRFARTTSDGVTIRAYEQPIPPGGFTYPCAAGPASPEVGSSSLDVEVSTAEVAVQTYSGYGVAQAPFTSISESTVGMPEGAPVWVVTAHTDASVAQVTVAFADGKTDQMAPIAGWAVLAHVAPSASAATSTPSGTVEARDASGKLIAGVAFPPPTVPQTALPGSVGGGAPPVTIVGVPPGAPDTTVPGQPVGTATTHSAVGLPPTPIPGTAVPLPCDVAIPPSPAVATTAPGGH